MDGRPIPAEIWREVLRCATLNPGALEPSIESQLQTLQWRYTDCLNYAASQHTKRMLMRVCKAWYAIGAEMLFEDCRPRNIHKFEHLVEVLKFKNASGHVRGDGWWIRRLHVPVPSWGSVAETSNGKDQSSILQPLLEAARLLPNLQILVFENRLVHQPPEDTENLVQAIMGYISPSLLYLDNDASNDRRPYPSVLFPFDSAPHLLRYSGLVMAGSRLDRMGPLIAESPPISHQRITSLTLALGKSLRTGGVDQLFFPSLRHLTLPHIRHGHLSHLIPFLTKHGPGLVTLSLQRSGSMDDRLTSLADNPFLACCPNLAEVILLSGMRSLFDEVVHPNVVAIGISAIGHESEMAIRELYRLGRFPNLRLVRVVDTEYLGMDVENDESIWSQFEDRGHVRFEDAEGNLIPVKGDDDTLMF